MKEKVKYYLDKQGGFVIENYNNAKPFSSFFPGIAGKWGVPAWVFYVNRAQAIASFGMQDKDNPVMEFQPANKSYYLTPLVGFRTFIKTRQNNKDLFYEPFSANLNSCAYGTSNSMRITSEGLFLSETNPVLGIETRVEYFTVPNDCYPGLARKVIIRNIGRREKCFDLLDGLPQIQPYGLNNMFLKQMSRTIEAWIIVENHNSGIPFVRLKVEPADRPEVVHVKKGNFYVSFDNTGIIKPIVQPEIVFGIQNDLTLPNAFLKDRRFFVPEKQSVKSKTPCAMAYKRVKLLPKEEYTLYVIAGNMSSIEKLKEQSARIADVSYIDKKQAENKALVCSLQEPVFTKSSSREFDLYCGQNFLDNIMRGGYPVSVEHPTGRTSLQLYSRKHGDIERDYNMFLLEPTFFSQGNGNYRDMNQNRRSDVWFNSDAGRQGVACFFNLIQTDGYNPLVICPDRFRFNQDYASLNNFFNRYNMKKIRAFLEHDFTPGELFSFIDSNNIMLRDIRESLLRAVMENSTKYFQAFHGEGFWIDHWHYCLDMLESYLGLYPESLKETLFDSRDYTFFDNDHIVLPREKKYVVYNNVLRQFGSVVRDEEKALIISKRENFNHISRKENGRGCIYRVSLISKMVIVIANKFASLDPFGTGIEMESDKPNWYDSLNGMPGLLGSSSCETFELKRWILFIKKSIKSLKPKQNSNAGHISLPAEVHSLLKGLYLLCEKGLNDYDFWDKRSSLKEHYRHKTRLGYKGNEEDISLRELVAVLDSFLKVIDRGIARAYDKNTRLHYSYFINAAVRYQVTSRADEKIYAKPLKFRQRPLPLFLEAIVHCMRVDRRFNASRRYCGFVRKSALFDNKLNMYKVCAPLTGMPEEIGRSCVFTPGWLENESIWLHMEYKYMLEMLKSGLYEEFYRDFKKVFVPFLKPHIYGRSILENSSFIVSSVFPDTKLHGNGFVARLSGSTAEFINIWLIMCAGLKPFYLDKDNRLVAELKPVLPSWLFLEKNTADFKKNTFSFRFLNKTLVVYHNNLRRNTFGKNASKIKEIIISFSDGKKIIQKSPKITHPFSYDLRAGKIPRVDIILK